MEKNPIPTLDKFNNKKPSDPKNNNIVSSKKDNNNDQQNYTYTASQIIGSGSFGVVYQATIAETGEVVAIKKVFQDKRYKNREL